MTAIISSFKAPFWVIMCEDLFLGNDGDGIYYTNVNVDAKKYTSKHEAKEIMDDYNRRFNPISEYFKGDILELKEMES